MSEGPEYQVGCDPEEHELRQREPVTLDASTPAAALLPTEENPDGETVTLWPGTDRAVKVETWPMRDDGTDEPYVSLILSTIAGTDRMATADALEEHTWGEVVADVERRFGTPERWPLYPGPGTCHK